MGYSGRSSRVIIRGSPMSDLKQKLIIPGAADEALNSAVIRILRPLVRILMGRAVPFRRLVDMIKWVYVDEAKSDLDVSGHRPSKSAVALRTGLCRKEVQRLIYEPMPPGLTGEQSYSRINKIAYAWRHQREFQDPDGMPSILPVSGGPGSFQSLVRKYGADITHRVVLREMVEKGAVEESNGVVRLVTMTDIRTREPELFTLFGRCVTNLVTTFEHNLDTAEMVNKRLQRELITHEIPSRAVPMLRQEINTEWERIWPRLIDLLEKFESGDPNQARHTVGVGFYYFSDDLSL